jgi:peptidyl-dipeptidase A
MTWTLVVGIGIPTLAFTAEPASGEGTPSTTDARAFVQQAEKDLLGLSIDFARASWVSATYITPDTDTLAAQSLSRLAQADTHYARLATSFDPARSDEQTARKLALLRVSTLAAPADAEKADELTRIASQLQSTYSTGRYCPEANQCMTLEDITRFMASSHDPARLADTWTGWHRIAPPMRPLYQRFVTLANEGARERGFADAGAMWRSWYDMSPAEFAAEIDRLWAQVRPLYVSLHAYVRWKLRERYGDAVPATGPLPAHLLGNLWAQDWSSLYPLVAPPATDPGYDLTEILKSHGIDATRMVRYAEGFFVSMGFPALPKTFWERSMFTRPRDREVECHPNARIVDFAQDVRIRLCAEVNARDFAVIHHELGHVYNGLAYMHQSPLFMGSAHDGFEEATGDVIALSVTPEYLVRIGLLDRTPDASRDTGLLLQSALDRVAFLPFGLLVDQWRWKVFSGEVSPAEWNRAWWDLRRRYQGVAPPLPRSENDFDPGGKYHVPANVPYARYFLATILQYQFHRALARAAGCTTRSIAARSTAMPRQAHGCAR